MSSVIDRMREHRDDQRRKKNRQDERPTRSDRSQILIGLECRRQQGERNHRGNADPRLELDWPDAFDLLHHDRGQRPGEARSPSTSTSPAEMGRPLAGFHMTIMPPDKGQHHSNTAPRTRSFSPSTAPTTAPLTATELPDDRRARWRGGFQAEEKQRESAPSHQESDAKDSPDRTWNRQQPRQGDDATNPYRRTA